VNVLTLLLVAILCGDVNSGSKWFGNWNGIEFAAAEERPAEKECKRAWKGPSGWSGRGLKEDRFQSTVCLVIASKGFRDES
jgi:hypothetical protein